MTPDDFIHKWDGVALREKQASQEHFLDLCALVGIDSPAKADPQGDWFCFEKGANKAGGGEGWADVWRRGCFAWEYKSPGKALDGAFRQLQLYTPALEYPPLLIVSDIDLIRIHTAFTGLVPARHDLHLADLRDPAKLNLLKWAFLHPERLRPTATRAQLTEQAAAQLGAEYTDPATIMRLVNPVVLDPLRAEWAAVKAEIQGHFDKAQGARSPAVATKARNAALELYQGFLHRLQKFRVLDPACGSGNFLLLSLLGLKDLEHQVITEAEALDLPRQFPMVGPENVLGIEINPFAAELARVSLWIGEIQWMLNHGFALAKSPIPRNLDNIQLRDAILNPDGTEPEWPEADVIVGNPPFLGDKKRLGALGAEIVTRLRSQYQGRVPGGADLVTYWVEKARAQINAGKVRLAGLVATNSIRGGANRRVLERIVETGSIFEAWSDEPWINDGAAVRVSLVAFGPHTFSSSPEGKGNQAVLNGESAVVIHADLTPGSAKSVDLTKATRLSANAGVSFIGTQQNGPFTVSPEMARKWLVLPNPHGAPNSEVVKPWRNGLDWP